MSNYFRFIESNRPEIGLAEIYDLSEIYDSDQRFALLNLGLDPEGLDQIFGLSNLGLSKEDIRTMGDLESSVINSLAIADTTLENVTFDRKNYISVDRPIGEPEKHSFVSGAYSDNITVLHGGIAAKSITYKFRDEEGNIRNTSVSVSRESLFNAPRDNSFRFISAEYLGLIRVRRRSHINRINLTAKIVREKPSIAESPTHVINIPTYMRTTSNTSPELKLIKSYAIKNSPLVLPVRIYNSATISFTRETTNVSSGFVYGWELKRFSDLEFVRSASINSVGSRTVNIPLNVVGTIGNGVECLLYVYLDPTQISEMGLSGIGLRELAGKDIGLIGFTSLKKLNLSNNRLSTIPIWLKTLYSRLEYLDISDNDYWQNGIVSVFDYQDMSSSGITTAFYGTVPSITLSQVLGYSGYNNTGEIIGYTGLYESVRDISGNLYKDLRRTGSITIDAVNGFRQFNSLKELILRSAIYIRNGDFSKLFPNLSNLNIDSAGNKPRTLQGLPPKINNNGQLISISMSLQQQCTGSLKYMGDETDWDEGNPDPDYSPEQFIGKFKISGFNAYETRISGGICTEASDVTDQNGTQRLIDGQPRYHHIISGGVENAWSGWLAEAQSINIGWSDIALKIAKDTSLNWQKLISVYARGAGNVFNRYKVRYDDGDTLIAPELVTLDAGSAGWWGKMFKIGSQTSKLKNLIVDYGEWEGYIDQEGRQYILPEGFSNPTTSSIERLEISNVINSSQKELELRTNDLNNLPRLTRFEARSSYLTGVFPNISNTSQTRSRSIYVDIRYCRFRDLRSLGSSNSSRISQIIAFGNGTGVGGSLLPSFNSPLNNVLYYVNFASSLPTKYPSNWHDITLRNSIITSAVSGSNVESVTPAGVLWTSRNNANTINVTSSKLYHNSAGFNIFSYVMVGDRVTGDGIPSTSDIFVTQIDKNLGFIYVSSDVSVSNSNLTFTRRGQNISSFFSNHYNLRFLLMPDCRLTGQIPTFQNSFRLYQVDLSNNLLSDYISGTIRNLTGVSNQLISRPVLRIFNLRNNPLSPQNIKSIINETHEVAVYFAQYGISPDIDINLLSTKLNQITRSYSNYQRSEILDSDLLTTKYEQLGTGNLYPNIKISIF